MNDVVLEEAPAEVALTAQDRCDSCGAQAYVYALLASGELLFCAHHWKKHEEKLSASAIKIVDMRHILLN